VVLSILLRNFWCRYLCPYGALLGVLSFFSILKVHRNAESCHNRGQVPNYNKEAWMRMMKKMRESSDKRP